MWRSAGAGPPHKELAGRQRQCNAQAETHGNKKQNEAKRKEAKNTAKKSEREKKASRALIYNNS